VRHAGMRATVAISFAATVVTLAGCTGTNHAAPAVSTHPVDTASPVSIASPIAKTRANDAVCLRFVRVGTTKASADRFMAWLTSGAGRRIGNRSSGVLIKDIGKWYDDSYKSFGNPANASADWAAVNEECRSISIFGPG
jgi:hypothetical protein